MCKQTCVTSLCALVVPLRLCHATCHFFLHVCGFACAGCAPFRSSLVVPFGRCYGPPTLAASLPQRRGAAERRPSPHARELSNVHGKLRRRGIRASEKHGRTAKSGCRPLRIYQVAAVRSVACKLRTDASICFRFMSLGFDSNVFVPIRRRV